MKKLMAMAVLFALAGPSAWAESAAKYKVDVPASKVEWVGKKVTGQHNGQVKLKSGELAVMGNAVTGGNIVIDMASITNEDLKDAEYNSKLTGHLKSDDFFGVAKHPTATFKITKVEPIANAKGTEANQKVTGDLTIKGMSHPLTFPATITVANGKAEANAKDVKIDRTLYDIRYGSGKFFQGLGDKVIYDDFLISFNIVAKK
jgi:polyisoprenoid-binding protein YceI